jgi:RNA polymerase sigma factor (sigma-70 family)
MSPATLRRYRAERMLERDFQALRGRVLATVRARLRSRGLTLDGGDLEACYATAWQGLYTATLNGEEIANAPAWLVLVTYRRAIEEVRARSRREAQLQPERAVEPALEAALDDRQRLRQLMEGMRARLDAREREAAALCYLHGFSRAQAARRMGISDTRMRKLMEGSGRGQAGVSGKVGALVETIREGAFCEQQDSLMRALAFGVLDPAGERYRLAVLHRRECPACRRYVATLRGVAAALPPVLTFPAPGTTSLAGLAGIGQHGAGAAAGGLSGTGLGPAASGGTLGASAAGSGAGGGWLLGSAGLTTKLATGCLLALGIGAGCVAIQRSEGRHPGSPSARHGPAVLLRRGGGASSAGGPASRPVVLVTAARRAREARQVTASLPAAQTGAEREFGPERRSSAARPAGPTPVRARSARTPGAAHAVAASSGFEPAAAPAPPGPAASPRAAEREFSPG